MSPPGRPQILEEPARRAVRSAAACGSAAAARRICRQGTVVACRQSRRDGEQPPVPFGVGGGLKARFPGGEAAFFDG
jgi:hypothetical protein